MAFWLAAKRQGQDSDWIQRFDPRFWTIDFPRPMMASAITPAPMRCASMPPFCAKAIWPG
jgi:hypothetical protein